MKLNLPTIIFGAALSAVSLGAMSPQAWAARVENVDSTAKISVTDDGAQNPKVGVDHNFGRADINFVLKQAVTAGDHIEFSTHAIPDFSNQDIYSDDTKTVIIGRLERVNAIEGSRSYQAKDNDKFPTSKPADRHQYSYKITFNENAEKLDDLSFAIGQFNRLIGYSVASEDYTSTAWVKVNDKEIASADFTVNKWSKSVLRNNLWLHEVVLNTDNNDRICMTVGFEFKQNIDGGKIHYSTKGNPYIKIVEQEGVSLGATRESNFIYTDNSKVNQYNLILKDDISTITYKLANKTEADISYDISMGSDYYSSGVQCINVELTDEGKKYIAANGELPVIDLDAKITDKSGATVWQGSTSKQMIVRGQSANFLSRIREEVEQILEEEDEPQVEDNQPELTPEIKEEPKKEALKIEAPHTGLEISGGAAIITSLTTLLSLTGLTLKRR